VNPPVIPDGTDQPVGQLFQPREQVKGEQVAMVRPFRRGVFSRVGLNVGEAVAPAQVQMESLRAQVAGLLAAR
jgi:hypothetical protein